MSETYPEEEVKIVELKLIQGGKVKPPTGPWLDRFGVGGIFVARRRKPMEGEDPAGASSFHVYIKMENSACLELVLWDSDMLRDRVFRRWWSIEIFSREWELLDIIDEGQRDRTDIEDRLAQHEGSDGEERIAGLDENTGQPDVRSHD